MRIYNSFPQWRAVLKSKHNSNFNAAWVLTPSPPRTGHRDWRNFGWSSFAHCVVGPIGNRFLEGKCTEKWSKFGTRSRLITPSRSIDQVVEFNVKSTVRHAFVFGLCGWFEDVFIEEICGKYQSFLRIYHNCWNEANVNCDVPELDW